MFEWLSIYLGIRLAHQDFHFFSLWTFDYYQKTPKIIPWKCSFQTAVCNFVSNSIQLHFDLFLLLFLSIVSCYAYNSSIHKDRCSELQRTLQWLGWYFFENILQIYGETNEFYDFFGFFNCFSATWQLICHQNTHFNGLDCPSPPQIYISPFVFTRGLLTISLFFTILCSFFLLLLTTKICSVFSIRKTRSISIYWNLLEFYNHYR